MQSIDSSNRSITNFFQDQDQTLKKVSQKQKKITLYDLPQIQSYKKMHKPVVSQQKKKLIKQKLDLQQESLLQTKQREKRGDYFLNYNENPFLKFDFNKAKTGIIERTQKEPVNGDIIQQLNELKQKQFSAEIQRMKEDFKDLRRNTHLLSAKIIDSSNKTEFNFFKTKQNDTSDFIKGIFESLKNKQKQNIQEKKTVQIRADQKAGKKQKRGEKDQIFKKKPIIAFKDIVDMKQQNFFMKSKEPINIFKFGFNNEKEILGKQILQKNYFSFTSMVQRLQKNKVSIYRDISRMGRKIILNQSTGKQDIFDYIDSYQLSFKKNQLGFHDIMSVASGRFSPEFVYKTMNFDGETNMTKDKSQTSSSKTDELQIYYDDQTINRADLFINKDEEQQQIKNYQQLLYNSKQKKYQDHCDFLKTMVREDLNIRENLFSTTIQDKTLHQGLSVKVQNQLKNFVKMDKKDLDMDRLIRMNKTHKNKNDSIRLVKILQTFQVKNEHQKRIKKLINMQKNPQIGKNKM